MQHINLLGQVKAWLEQNGREVHIGAGDRRVKHPGQILGCNASAAKSVAPMVDQFLYLGSGDFHPLAVCLDTGKPVLVMDLTMREIRDLDDLRERVLRQRHGAVARALDAKSFGIIVSTKIGQRRAELAQRILAVLREKGRGGCIIVLDNVSPDQLLAFDVDAFVSTACPRLAIDDYLRYQKPMLTPVELEVVLGLREWGEYTFDSIVG